MDQDKSKLEKKVLEGIYGQPELKKDEKRLYLGEFAERVLKYLTFQQVIEPGVYPEIVEAIKNSEARRLILDRRIDLKAANEYIKLAHDHNLAFKKVDSPELKGDIALVVVSDHAVEPEQRKVLSRKERLRRLGISDTIIENVGAKLCKKCWTELEDKAPAELINYKKMNWLDRLSGLKCVCSGN